MEDTPVMLLPVDVEDEFPDHENETEVDSTVCVFCESSFAGGTPEALYSRFAEFYPHKESFKCLKCQKLLSEEQQMYACLNSNNSKTHPLPFLLCVDCNLAIFRTQQQLEFRSKETKENIMKMTVTLANKPVEMKLNQVYSDLIDFSMLTPRAAELRGDIEPVPRCLVLGATGVGKSSILNKMAGVKYVLKIDEADNSDDDDDDSDDDAVEERKENTIQIAGGTLLFRAEWSSSMEAITSETAFSDIRFLGNEDRRMIVIDTPGTNDPDLTRARHQELDLNQKLQRAGEISVVLVVLGKNLLDEMRMDAKTLETLKDIHYMFCGSPQDEVEEEQSQSTVSNDEFWDHVVVCISKCDSFDSGWKTDKKKKLNALRKKLQKEFKTNVKIPILPLSAVQREVGEETPWKWSHEKNFEKLWEAISKKRPIITKDVRVRHDLRLQLAEKKRQAMLVGVQLEMIDLFHKEFTRKKLAEERRHWQELKEAENTAETAMEGLKLGASQGVDTVERLGSIPMPIVSDGVQDLRKGSYKMGLFKVSSGVGLTVMMTVVGAEIGLALCAGRVAVGIARSATGANRREDEENDIYELHMIDVTEKEGVLVKKEKQIQQNHANRENKFDEDVCSFLQT